MIGVIYAKFKCKKDGENHLGILSDYEDLDGNRVGVVFLDFGIGDYSRSFCKVLSFKSMDAFKEYYEFLETYDNDAYVEIVSKGYLETLKETAEKARAIEISSDYTKAMERYANKLEIAIIYEYTGGTRPTPEMFE